MKCVACNYENQEGAKFCRGCGAKLELSTTVAQDASLLKCIFCGSNNIASAKFCAKCGKKMTGEVSPSPVESSAARAPATPTFATPLNSPVSAISPQAPKEKEPMAVQKVAPNRKRIYAFLGIVIALIAIGGGGYLLIQQREEQRLALEEKQRALAAAEQAQKEAEAKLVQQKQEAEAKQKELENQRREAELKQREAEVQRQAAEVKQQKAGAARMEQEAREREAAATRARQKPTASAPSPAPQTSAPQRVTVQQACARQGNFFTRAICEATECNKSANYNDPICVQQRANR